MELPEPTIKPKTSAQLLREAGIEIMRFEELRSLDEIARAFGLIGLSGSAAHVTEESPYRS